MKPHCLLFWYCGFLINQRRRVHCTPPLLGNMTLLWGTCDDPFYYKDDSYDLITQGRNPGCLRTSSACCGDRKQIWDAPGIPFLRGPSYLCCRFTLFSVLLPYQISSVAQSCPTLCDPIDCSTPGLPVHSQLPEFTQTHVHWVGDAIQPSHPLSSPSPPAFNLSQHRGFSNESVLHLRWPKYWLEFQLQHQSFQWIFRTDFL